MSTEIPDDAAAIVFHADGELQLLVPKGEDDEPAADNTKMLAVTALLFNSEHADILHELTERFERAVTEMVLERERAEARH